MRVLTTKRINTLDDLEQFCRDARAAIREGVPGYETETKVGAGTHLDGEVSATLSDGQRIDGSVFVYKIHVATKF